MTDDGGAIDSAGSTTITGSTFDGNTAGGEGGAIEAAYTLNISDSVIVNNHAGTEAGGVNIVAFPGVGSVWSVNRCNISHNSAARNAG